MNIIDLTLGSFFGLLMRLCYAITGSFGWTLILFTALTKVVLFPVSLISQKNSIIMVKIRPLLDDLQARYEGEAGTIISEQKALYKRENYSTVKAILPLLVQIPLIIGVISVVNNPARHIGSGIDSVFFGIDLLELPDNMLVPTLAVLSTIFLCVMQNKYNVLSREQGFFGKWGIMAFLTVFTGWFVFVCPSGVGLYWTYSNITSVIVLAVCNSIYNPKDYIDYENRSARHKITSEERKHRREKKRREKRLEKEDMGRFFSVKKELVFYSEASGYYKFFQHFISYILEHSDITVHYITSDAEDQVFGIDKQNFETYFCSSHGLITTFMKMDSDVVVMTMPDLETFHYKRSLVRKDIEYIYTDHGAGSFHLLLRKGALDNFDTIFCYSKNHNDEVRATERVYGLREKKLVNVGFGLLDMLIKGYEDVKHLKNDKPQILIAPSWQKDNILEICIDRLLDELLKLDARVIIRPHPEFVKRFPGKMRSLSDRYKDRLSANFEIQTDFASNSTVYNSDLVITDWSSIALEFSFTTKKPSLFINTPMKIVNPEWEKIDIKPMDIWIRDIIGVSIETDELDRVSDVAMKMLENSDQFSSSIEQFLSGHMYNMGHTAEAGGEYIIGQITERRKQ